MADCYHFEDVFGSNPNLAYDEDTRGRIRHHRQSLENELFVDRLLKALGIRKTSAAYPPESNRNLKELFQRIAASSSPEHHKHSVVYYLLKDLSQAKGDHEHFARASYLPDKYKTFIDGIWYLDRLKFERALDYLTEPASTPTFSEEILYTLCRHTSRDDVTLPIAYFHTVSPSITSSKVLEAYFLVLCRANVTEAFYFSRAQGDMNHRVLFEQLIAFVHTNSTGAIKATRGVELISLPLNEEEESWFDAYLEEKGSTLPGAIDTFLMRGVATGRTHSKEHHRRRPSGRRIDGMNWDTLRNSTLTA
ncbi:hypothetical protein N7G274_002124 [Stereocaulon virgatum]|uniref:ELYS-like domain-containing protein n=1 Tax=Stereocaulon virgatum TaxID=373712 RepID=A0ABR4ALY6_9LECA